MTFAISIALMKIYRTSPKGSYSRVKEINADPKQYFLLIRLNTEMECPQWLSFSGKGGVVMVTTICHYSALWNS